MIVACPLTADVNQTKRTFIIKYFTDPTKHPAYVLDCFWNTDLLEFVCLTEVDAELIELQSYRVLQVCPKTESGMDPSAVNCFP
ncbi:hypothetical protein ACOMHN_054589 [Nucella lapillus]